MACQTLCFILSTARFLLEPSCVQLCSLRACPRPKSQVVEQPAKASSLVAGFLFLQRLCIRVHEDRFSGTSTEYPDAQGRAWGSGFQVGSGELQGSDVVRGFFGSKRFQIRFPSLVYSEAVATCLVETRGRYFLTCGH